MVSPGLQKVIDGATSWIMVTSIVASILLMFNRNLIKVKI